MLLILGILQLEVTPMNTNEITRQTGADFVNKEVIGARQPVEFVGDQDEKVTMKCTLYPQALGGESELKKLHDMRISGIPYLLMRGDGEVKGWYVVQSVSEDNTYLSGNGVPQVSVVTIQLLAADRPPAAIILDYMIGLLSS